MKRHGLIQRKASSLSGAVVFCVAVALAAVGLVGLGLWAADGRGWPALVPASALGLSAVLGGILLARGRAARRLDAALDAYVERQLGRVPRP